MGADINRIEYRKRDVLFLVLEINKYILTRRSIGKIHVAR